MLLFETLSIQRNATKVSSNFCRLLLAIATIGCGPNAFASDIARWTFETLPSGTFATGISPGSIPANFGAGTATGLHSSPTTVWSGAIGNGSLRSLNSNNWSVLDYLQFNFSTVGFSNLNFSWDELQVGSSLPTATVPSYSLDGTNFTPFGTGNPVTTGIWNSSTYSSGFTTSLDLSGVPALQNQANVYIRLSSFPLSVPLPPTAQLRFDNVVATGTPSIGPGIRDWINASGGPFATSTNWSPALVPGANDDAYFEIGQATYTTAFSANAASKSLKVSGDQVTLNLNGYTYTTSDSTVNSVIVQNQSTSFNAKLRVTVGNLVARGVFVDSAAGAQSSLEVVGNGAQLHRSGTTSDVQLGSVGRGTLLVDDYGYLEADRLLIGEASNIVNDTSGAVTISNHGHVVVGGAARFGANGGDSDLQVLNGGWLETGGASNAESKIGLEYGTNKALVSGAASKWNSTGAITVGGFGSGEVSIENGGLITSTNAYVHSSGKVTVTGQNSMWAIADTLDVRGDYGSYASATVNVQLGGQISVGKKVEIGLNGSLNVFAPVGLVTVGEVSNASGLGGEILVGTGGVLTGSGSVYAGGVIGVQSGGVIAPGINSPGILNLDNYYQQDAGATLKIDVYGSNAYDKLNMFSAIIAGNLEVTLQSGFTPTYSTQLYIVQANQHITGGFANLDANSRITTTGGEGSFLVGVAYSFIYLYGFSPTGDFNHNGTVDAADYVVWRKGLGTTYTQNDYTIWRSNFGKTAGSAAGFAAGTSSVPEPASALMMFYASISFAGNYRRRTHSVAGN